MRGVDILELRQGLGLEAYAFAITLGVHTSTLYRCERSRRALKMDPLQAEILTRLAVDFRARTPSEKSELGQKIVSGLLTGGQLYGLAALLDHITRPAEGQ